MTASRLESLEKMLKDYPQDRRLHYFLALEYRRVDRHPEAAEHLRAYIDAAPDEDVGAAWRDLGQSLEATGKSADARVAFQGGIASAHKHNHQDLAREIEGLVARLGR